MAEDQEKQKEETQELLKASKLEATVKECLISPSQEEILQQMKQSSQLSDATTSPSQPSSRDCFTVGALQTIIYTPHETPTQPNSDSEEDTFDPKFESDREESQSLNTQCLHITKSFAIFNSPLQTPFKKRPHSALPLPEAASANSKFCNPTPPENNATAKPSSCRRRLIGPSEEVSKFAKSPPDLRTAETLTDTPHPNSQVNYGKLFDGQDFNQLDTEDFQNLGQIETSDLPGPSAAGKLAEVDEKGQGKSPDKETRARRTLPPIFSDTQRKISAPSCLERGSSAPTFLEKEVSGPTSLDPKRQIKITVAKPYPETLMDVIMHCSGEPPVGYEDADVLEAAINAGITFPPPLSRHSYCK